SALMADVAEAPVEAVEAKGETAKRLDQSAPIEKIIPNPDQPRQTFADDDLRDLANSIREKGVIQPLIVRPVGEKFQIVAGERRWRAAQQAQLHELPIVVRELDGAEVLEIAIIENIQRADLNAIEEALGYRQLMDKFGHTQEKMAEALGKSRSHIANLLRLLSLPDGVQTFLRDGKLSAGHARALITASKPEDLAKKVIAGGLSVRQTEMLVKNEGKEAAPKPKTAKSPMARDADTVALEGDLSAALGMKVQLNHPSGAASGSITINYSSLDQLDDLCMVLTKPQSG
ncbi:MAG: ParB/RepB/Spo0J family partition protein, partial [Paracoccaceae bacterium]|nr:ParB/RepB/Spo0J family partition protein [Paracoccaceae bacterium]